MVDCWYVRPVRPLHLSAAAVCSSKRLRQLRHLNINAVSSRLDVKRCRTDGPIVVTWRVHRCWQLDECAPPCCGGSWTHQEGQQPGTYPAAQVDEARVCEGPDSAQHLHRAGDDIGRARP